MTSPFWTPGHGSWQGEVSRLRTAGVGMPTNPTMARQEAMNMATSVHNKSLTAQMNRRRLGNYRDVR